MPKDEAAPTDTGSGLEPLGDPDAETPDFANEHEQFEVDNDEDDAESESPGPYAGGLDHEGTP